MSRYNTVMLLYIYILRCKTNSLLFCFQIKVGRLAALSGREALMDWLERPTSMEQLRQDPVFWISHIHAVL
jgi:hypothetical protein